MSHTVTSLRPGMSWQQRNEMHLASLDAVVSALEAEADSGAQTIEAIDSAETRLSLLRARLKMSRSLIHLTSAMGKAP